MADTKPTSGMYGENPIITIGRFTIAEMTLPAGDSIFIEDVEGGDGMQFGKTHFEKFLKEWYDKNF